MDKRNDNLLEWIKFVNTPSASELTNLRPSNNVVKQAVNVVLGTTDLHNINNINNVKYN